MDNTARKTLSVCFSAVELSEEIFKKALEDFVHGKNVEKTGKKSLSNIYESAHGKLESIEISEKNIQSFEKTAAKYDINFAVKCDKSVNPPMYHVFFDTSKTENFKKAFTEYVNGVQEKQQHSKRYRISRNKLREINEKVKKQEKEKAKQKEKQKGLNREISL